MEPNFPWVYTVHIREIGQTQGLITAKENLLTFTLKLLLRWAEYTYNYILRNKNVPNPNQLYVSHPYRFSYTII